MCVSGPSPDEAASRKPNGDAAVDPDEAVRLATVGLLVQALVSFPASAALSYFNRKFGITNWYHASAILYGVAVLCIGFVSHYWQTLIIMSVLGIATPPIFSSSYILVEVYAAEADEDDSDEEDDDEDAHDEEGGTLSTINSVAASRNQSKLDRKSVV